MALAGGGSTSSEDVVHEALARAWERGDRIDHLDRWVLTVALHLARNRGRMLRREVVATGSGADRPAPGGDDGGPGVDRRRVLRALPARQREVVVLQHLLDLPVAEVAELLGLSPGGVEHAPFRPGGRRRRPSPPSTSSSSRRGSFPAPMPRTSPRRSTTGGSSPLCAAGRATTTSRCRSRAPSPTTPPASPPPSARRPGAGGRDPLGGRPAVVSPSSGRHRPQGIGGRTVAEQSDVLLELWREQRAWARQAEDQRATFTNFILVIAAAAIGGLSSAGLAMSRLPIALGLVVLGVFGAASSAKFYERFRYHNHRARVVYQQLEGEIPGLEPLSAATRAAIADHEQELRMAKVPLHALWTALHVAIALAGVGLTVAIVVSSNG